MHTLLGKIADVRIGLTLRGPDAADRTCEEGVHLLRVSDLTEHGGLEIRAPHLVDPELVGDGRYQIRPGDLVIANRGSRLTAAIVPQGLAAIAGGQLFVIRLKTREVLPPYLHWFLNLPATQDHLRSHTRGSYVQSLSIATLRELTIPVPPVETQERIAEYAHLAATERRLLDELARKRAQLQSATSARILARL